MQFDYNHFRRWHKEDKNSHRKYNLFHITSSNWKRNGIFPKLNKAEFNKFFALKRIISKLQPPYIIFNDCSFLPPVSTN